MSDMELKDYNEINNQFRNIDKSIYDLRKRLNTFRICYLNKMPDSFISDYKNIYNLFDVLDDIYFSSKLDFVRKVKVTHDCSHVDIDLFDDLPF